MNTELQGLFSLVNCHFGRESICQCQLLVNRKLLVVAKDHLAKVPVAPIY